MRIGSLFSGIGGLELGLERSGVGHTVWQVEQDEFCRSVLARHWPDVERFEDVREVGAAELEPADLLCGGFPCQDVSAQGKGAGLTGERSGLWLEYARIVEILRPRWVVVENVAGGARRWVDQVRIHLGELGYETLPVPLSARAVGAPHKRERIFILAANTSRERLQGLSRSGRKAGPGAAVQRFWVDREAPEPRVHSLDDGLSSWVDRHRAIGNAVVPQCAEVVGWMIREIEGAP